MPTERKSSNVCKCFGNLNLKGFGIIRSHILSIWFCLFTEISNLFQDPFDYGIYECENMSVIPLLFANDGIEQTLFTFGL